MKTYVKMFPPRILSIGDKATVQNRNRNAEAKFSPTFTTEHLQRARGFDSAFIINIL